MLLVVPFPFSFLPTVNPPTHSSATTTTTTTTPPALFLLLRFFFHSIFHYDYQDPTFTLYAAILSSFSREPASRTEQRTEYKFFSIFSSSSSSSRFSFSSLFLFFASTLFQPTTTLLAGSATYQREMRAVAPSLSLSFAEQHDNFPSENANDRSQHLCNMLPFSREMRRVVVVVVSTAFRVDVQSEPFGTSGRVRARASQRDTSLEREILRLFSFFVCVVTSRQSRDQIEADTSALSPRKSTAQHSFLETLIIDRYEFD